jgi:pimeloyl-ACP methyl ester carboxylesterase
MTIETLRTVTRDGVNIRFVEEGTGDPALVFVHGWTCNHTNWREQLAHFTPAHRVVALDQRGHGASDKPDQDYLVPGFVDDLAWFIRELGLERPVVVGHSMGGEIALNLAHQHTDLVRGIVMVDSPIVPLPEAMRPIADAATAAMKLDNYKPTAEGFARTQFFNAGTPQELVEELVPVMMAAPQRLMYSAIESILDPTNMPAGEIPVPALFIRAATAFASDEQFRERYPGLEVHKIDCAHFVQMEKPAETNALIDGFLERIA